MGENEGGMATMKTLEKLVNVDGKLFKESGQEVRVALCEYPTIICVNQEGMYLNQVLQQSAPPNADVYILGNATSAPVTRGPYWDYYPVQYARVLEVVNEGLGRVPRRVRKEPTRKFPFSGGRGGAIE